MTRVCNTCRDCIFESSYESIGMNCCNIALQVAKFHNKIVYPTEAVDGMTEHDIVFEAPTLSFIERVILNIRMTIAINRFLKSNGYPRVYYIKIIKGDVR